MKSVAALSAVAQWQGYVRNTNSEHNCGAAQTAAVAQLIQMFSSEAFRKNKVRVKGSIPEALPPDSTKSSLGLKNPGIEASRVTSSPLKSGSDTFKIETAPVVVPVSVTDRDGRFISDLAKEDFQIYEDNSPQTINHFSPVEVPLNVAVALDASSSMRIQEGDLRTSAGAFVSSLRPQDRAMVISFNSSVFINCELTADRFLLGSAVQQTVIAPGTRLYDAIDLIQTERFNQIAGRKAIVLFTDGVDTESRLADARRTLELSAESGALIYTIHYDTSHDVVEQNLKARIGDEVLDLNTGRSNAVMIGSGAYRRASEYLQDLTAITGGRTCQAFELSSLKEAFKRIGDELRQQYEIAYYPTNLARDGSIRRINIHVNRPEAIVRARPGYRAVKDTP